MDMVICGSMAFAKDMMAIRGILEERGHHVIVPKNTDKYADGTILAENKWEKMHEDVIRRYFEKIRCCDAILVVNKDKNGVANYVGGNSLLEMGFAHVLHKKIFLLNPIPSMNYSDELEAMSPVILDGCLDRITDC